MISLILPAHNEAEYLERAVEEAERILPGLGEYEVLIAEDGSTDGTAELAERLAAESESVRHVHYDERLGRGEALGRAFRAAEGDLLLYMDVDLATDPEHLVELVQRLRDGADVVTGSRYARGSEADRSGKREFVSRAFNFSVRALLGSELRDHQCGFKGFRREALLDVLPDVQDDHWFWDTELLVRASQRGYRVEEFPVRWSEIGNSKVDFWRDIVGMGSELTRLWWDTRVSPRITRRRAALAGLLLTVVAVLLLGQYIDLGEVVEEMRHTDPTLLGIAGVVYLTSWPLRGARYREILERLGYREGLGFLTGVIFISQTGNLVFPARAGDAVRAYVVKSRRSIPYPSGFASLAVERVFDLLTITVLATSVLLLIVATGETTIGALLHDLMGADQRSGHVALEVAAGVGLLAILSLVAIVASARSDSRLVRSAVTRFSEDSYALKFVHVVERFVKDIQLVATDRSSFIGIGFSSLLIWAIDVVTAALVLVAFDTGLPLTEVFAVCFFAVSVGNLAKVLPLSPGGIGLYEGAFSLIVVALTPLTIPIALGAALVDHLLKNVVTIVGGFLSMMILNVSLTRAVEAGAESGSSETLVERGES